MSARDDYPQLARFVDADDRHVRPLLRAIRRALNEIDRLRAWKAAAMNELCVPCRGTGEGFCPDPKCEREHVCSACGGLGVATPLGPNPKVN